MSQNWVDEILGNFRILKSETLSFELVFLKMANVINLTLKNNLLL